MAAAATLSALAATPTADARSRRVTLRPSGDAYVRANRPGANFGHLGVLRVDGRPRSRAYLRFRLRGQPRLAVARASLRIYVRSGRRSGIQAHRTRGRNWAEGGLSWRRAPALRATIAVSSPARGHWATIDVTPLVHTGGRVDIALSTSHGRASVLASREAGGRFAPRLLLRVYHDTQPRFPIRAAFYSTAFPEGWIGPGLAPATRYIPALGFYSSRSESVLSTHLRSMRSASLDAALANWTGLHAASDARLGRAEATARKIRTPLRLGVEARTEVAGNPPADRLVPLLAYLDRSRGRDRAYLRVRGRPVVFVALGSADRCAAARRWANANAAVGTYLMLETFPGYRSCRAQVSGWYQRDSGRAAGVVPRRAYTISPGFFAAGESRPRLVRDLTRWYSDVRAMVGSKARWQLVSSFNDWGEGTAVEPAEQWASPSGRGLYLDALRARGQPPAGRPGGDPAIAAAGDIACSPASSSYDDGLGTTIACRQRDTANLLLRQRLDAALALGDLQYEHGALADFRVSFEHSWGRLGPLLRPAIGNHEYSDPAGGAAGYWDYFGSRAGPRGEGWYSFDVGRWHIVALNSNCRHAGGCGSGSPQEAWLRADLAAHPAACTLAFFHHPLFASGGRGNNGATSAVRPLWRDLYDAGAELVINAHVHVYERFARQAPDGQADPSGGIREFVVGTGGKSLLPLSAPRPNSQVRENTVFGALRLVLHPTSYEWRFLPVAGGSFTDAGSESCR